VSTGGGVQTSTVCGAGKKIVCRDEKRHVWWSGSSFCRCCVALRLHLRAFTQGEGSISDCQEKLDFYTIFRCLAG